MATTYRAVGWNAQKVRYDRALFVFVLAALCLFAASSWMLAPEATVEGVAIRAAGLTAFALLHVVLSIGPLCRLDARFLPLLYNRRHLGVATFVLGLVHGGTAFVLHHTLGIENPLASMFQGGSANAGLAGLPFQPFGVFALLVLFAMAATSHDFWLRTLSPRVWKTLHMGVYAAYAALVLHVALGALQAERALPFLLVVAVSLFFVLSLHVLAARREARADERSSGPAGEDFVDVGPVDAIPSQRAITAVVAGERVAVFRHDDCVSAVSAVCRHQHGPLGEGKVLDGCITCPWHGYQYRPRDGQAPPPFHEKLPTFRVRVENGRVLVGSRPLPPGTDVEPARVTIAAPRSDRSFYVGWAGEPDRAQSTFTRRAVLAFVAGALVAIALVASTQRTLAGGVFEYGVRRAFRGLVEFAPYPLLHAMAPAGGTATFLVVGEGKHGAETELRAFAGTCVSLRGSLIHRDDSVALELEPGSVAPADDIAPPAPRSEVLGRATLRGEIVDSKCHLGVMTPGDRETHRACARLCIAGGVPPLFVVADERGRVLRYLLVDADGKPIGRRVLDFVGEPVEVDGEMVRHGELLVLRVDPSDVRRTRDPTPETPR